jgi:beta-hydroxylase
MTQFLNIDTFPKLAKLRDNWKAIQRELKSQNFGDLGIHRDGKSHEEVYSEVTRHLATGGDYGWLQGWGKDTQRQNWTQLALVLNGQSISAVAAEFPFTLDMLKHIDGVKVAAFLKLKPNTLIETHSHPELSKEGILQMHLTVEAAKINNFSYINVAGEFRQHVLGEAFAFDGSKPHFAVNASTEERTILYLEFNPSI